MGIEDVLDSKLIFFNSDFLQKKDIINFIADEFEKNNYISNSEEFVTAVYDREKIGVTGIGSGIAIPHGKSSVVLKPGVSVIKLKKAVNWESLDNKPISLIVLFAIGNNLDGDINHLRILASFAAKLGNDQKIKDLIYSNSKEELIANLKR